MLERRIALETSKGDLPLAVGLGVVLIIVVLGVNALAWALRDPRMTSLVIGASSVEQLEANVAALDNLDLDGEELDAIDGTVLDL